MKRVLLILTIILYTNLCANQNPVNLKSFPPAAGTPPEIGFFKGFNWGTFGQHGDYIGPAAENSMRLLAAANADSVCIVFAMTMQTKSSVTIQWDKTNPALAGDLDVRNAIRLAKEQHFKVILKPSINCNDGTWRAKIDFRTHDGRLDTVAWRQWWKSYTEVMLYYAKLAQETGCHVYCIGCELSTTEAFETEWRGLIAQIRKEFKGLLVYNANHGSEEQLTWWDAVDYIGISAYYPVGTGNAQNTSGVKEMKLNWQPIRQRLNHLSQRWNRPVLFSEIGVCSIRGASAAPWDYAIKNACDLQEQANYYQAALETFWDEPWFAGFLWWAWDCPLDAKENADRHGGYCPYGKPAEAVVRDWYAKTRK